MTIAKLMETFGIQQTKTTMEIGTKLRLFVDVDGKRHQVNSAERSVIQATGEPVIVLDINP